MAEVKKLHRVAPLALAAILIGISLAGAVTPPLIGEGEPALGVELAWRLPLGLAAIAIAALRYRPQVGLWATRLTVAVGSLGALVALWELVFWIALPGLPLDQQPFVDPPTSLASQVSKRGRWPESYVLICGDSYAQGMGDWLLSQDHGTNPPFHSADVVHERLGTDVLAIGRGGFGNLEGLVVRPCSWTARLVELHGVDPPRRVVAYLYEGNDFTDNVRDLGRLELYDPRAQRAPGPVPFERLEAEGLPRLVAEELARLRGLGRLSGLRFLRTKAREGGGPEDLAEWRRQVTPSFEVHGEFNRATVGGAEVQLPGRLQGPALELSSEETDLALAMFGVCLRSLKRAFPTSELTVAYLPSPLSCYALSGQVEFDAVWDRPRESTAERVTERSDLLASRAKAECQRAGVRFVDLRPGMREAARETLLHGPLDWQHLNRVGQERLGELVAEALR